MKEIQVLYTCIGILYCFFIVCVVVYAASFFREKDSKNGSEDNSMNDLNQKPDLNDMITVSKEVYTAKRLARYILSKCINDNHRIDNLALNQILYMIQLEFVRYKGKPAFYDEIEAKRFGAIVPSVYYHYCGYGANLIDFAPKYDSEMIRDIVKDASDKEHIDALIDYFRRLEPWNWAHTYFEIGNNTAWDVVYDSGNGNGKVITMEHMKMYG